LSIWDLLIIITYFVISFGIAFYFFRKAGKDTNEFFLSGRNLPWYLAGLSMVATTFAADTPLAVTELVAKNGIAGNWLWWNFAFGGMLTVFFFSRLWRRAGVVTEVEFAELRYSGKPARFLRGFRAVYLGLIMNIVIIGWVNKAMASILTGFFGISNSEVYFYIFACMLLVAVYSALSGLWGVVITDAFQFFIAMTGCIILAIIVLNSPQVGGIDNLKRELSSSVFSFFPNITSVGSVVSGFTLSVFSFLAYVGIIWWASWYPGAEPGGGGYVVQRMLSAKNEKHSLFATLFFQIAHYAIRPWPWIIVALCTLILYPALPETEKGMGYIYAMKDFLPVGLKGLLVAAFFAAYMSTVATQLNWGTSYLINDFYRRFLKKDRTEKHYIFSSRVVTLILMSVSVIATLFIQEISGAWKFILECGAGVGLVLILRWFWWRINAWSEISAMVTPFIIYPVLKNFNVDFPLTLFIIVPCTTLVWLVVTYLTKPVDDEILLKFYIKIHPGGILWKKISDKLPGVKSDGNFFQMFLNWIFGVILIYSLLFSIGSLLFGNYVEFFIYLSIGLISVLIIYKNLQKIGWDQI
jgi:solute:Na+ symporter, SSS family